MEKAKDTRNHVANCRSARRPPAIKSIVWFLMGNSVTAAPRRIFLWRVSASQSREKEFAVAFCRPREWVRIWKSGGSRSERVQCRATATASDLGLAPAPSSAAMPCIHILPPSLAPFLPQSRSSIRPYFLSQRRFALRSTAGKFRSTRKSPSDFGGGTRAAGSRPS